MTDNPLDSAPVPEMTDEGDFITFRLPRGFAISLVQQLSHWRKIEDLYYKHMTEPEWADWKRSPILRENRRESVVYGNCLSAIECLLGRHNMKRLREIAEAAEESSRPAERTAAP